MDAGNFCFKKIIMIIKEPNVEVDTDICSRLNGFIKSPPARTLPSSMD